MPVAPPNHSGNSPSEEGRKHKGKYESYHRHKKSLAERSVKFPAASHVGQLGQTLEEKSRQLVLKVGV